MQIDDAVLRRVLSKDLVDVFIRIGLIGFGVVLCARVFAPFAGLMLWALILAVALYPLHVRLVKRLNDRQVLAAVLLVSSGILLLALPTVLLGSSFAGYIHDLYTAIENNTITIPHPDASVASWPLVGEQIHSIWSTAADNLPALLKEVQPQIKAFSTFILSAAANAAGSVFLFIGSLFISGIMMFYGETGSQAMQKIFCRLTGTVKGPQLQSLSIATIRSVASGVIGVAFIQALLLGVGFIMAGIPAAGVLALIVLFLGIVQLPAAVVSLSVIVYLWWFGDASTASNIFYTIYLLVAGMADNVLKPLLLGRGVEAPMPVILLGALGGLVSAGIIGLFIGAVLLAVGYQVFMGWVDNAEAGVSAEPGQTETSAQVSANSH